jgi:hypothetical protein
MRKPKRIIPEEDNYEKNIISREVYSSGEIIQADRNRRSVTGISAVEQVKRKAEIENGDVLSIPEDKAEFSYSFNGEQEDSEDEFKDEDFVEEEPEE